MAFTKLVASLTRHLWEFLLPGSAKRWKRQRKKGMAQRVMSVGGEESLRTPENTNSAKQILLPAVNVSCSLKMKLIINVPSKMLVLRSTVRAHQMMRRGVPDSC